MTLRRLTNSLVALAACCLATAAQADERILSYHSDIAIASDASMMVEETIRVRAEGNEIRRGIFRDFPTDYRDRYGNRFIVDFEVVMVTRNDEPEPWHAERLSNGVRVYVGSADARVPVGIHTYRIHYRTNRQIGFFEDHDELYWNATGHGWGFPIDAASATVVLPGVVPRDMLSMEGYTGAYGSQARDVATELGDSGGTISTTKPLRSREGLTLVMSWPKGIVAQPTAMQRFGYLLQDNRGLLFALTALLLVGIYLYVVWSRYGKDPEPGVIYPRYEPPNGYSPASARYIAKMGYSGKALSAAVINLAVKGHLVIEEADDDYVLRKTESREGLAPGESVLLKNLFAESTTIELDNKNHKIISKARSAHKSALKKDYHAIYFRKNSGLLVLPILGCVLTIILITTQDAWTPLAVLSMVTAGVLIAVFSWLLKAPTPRGRLLMDELEGFRMYLEVAEKEDLNRLEGPELTPGLFERFLPYAVALGVEQAWAERFTKIFARLADQNGQDYRPIWYQGHFHHSDMGGFANSMSSSFSSAISSAASAPGSASGSGGGGFSGGGGGGGGGGGW
jgi:uncharacterized membrane protein YgcG